MRKWQGAVVGLIALVAACMVDKPTAPVVAAKPSPDRLFSKVSCVGNVLKRVVACSSPGGQTELHQLSIIARDSVISSDWNASLTNVTYDSATQIYAWDETVGDKLSYQPIGTANWIAQTGVKMFIDTVYATSGTGTITGANEDGTGNFGIYTSKPYWEYAQVMWPGQYSHSHHVELNVPTTVVTFHLDEQIYTAVPPNNEPSGYTEQIYSGAMTATPSCGMNQTNWTVNGKTWTMVSVDTGAYLGGQRQGDCSNLIVVPDTQASGVASGYRVVYPATLAGGSDPVKFYTSIPTQGTGYMYARWLQRLDSIYTDNGNNLTKYWEPRTPQQGSGSTQQNDVVIGAVGSHQTEAWMQFIQQGSSTTDLPCFEYCSPYDPKGFYHDSTANIGGNHRGKWHVVEMLITPNTLSVANGCLTIWVDTVQEWNECDVKYFVTGNTEAWNNATFEPVYGGVGHQVPAGGLWWDLDQFYVSTK